MKTLSKIAAALVICLSLVSVNAGMASAGGPTDQYAMINAEVGELEELLLLSMMAGDYRAASELEAQINDLELLQELMYGSNKISSGDLGSGRFSDISSGDLGSGRITGISNGDLGSGR